MEFNRLLLVFTLCLISRTLAFETKKLSQPLQKDILNSVLKEPVRLPSETRIKHADEEEDEYDPIDTKRSPPYLTSMGKETDFKGTETESEDSVCLQPKKQGPCKARMVRFFYDQTSKSCKEFIYGGCQRNDNNFKTQKKCEEKCSN